MTQQQERGHHQSQCTMQCDQLIISSSSNTLCGCLLIGCVWAFCACAARVSWLVGPSPHWLCLGVVCLRSKSELHWLTPHLTGCVWVLCACAARVSCAGWPMWRQVEPWRPSSCHTSGGTGSMTGCFEQGGMYAACSLACLI